MGTHTVHRTAVTETRPAADFGRLLLTLIGGAALIVAAFLYWTRGLVGDNLSNRSLVKVEFATQTDIVRTVGGISVLLGLVALLGLVDRTGWLTRLAGALGIVLFVLFAIEVYRSSHHQLQIGAWMALGGGVVLVLGGMLGGHEVVAAPTAVEQQVVKQPVVEQPIVNPDKAERASKADRSGRADRADSGKSSVGLFRSRKSRAATAEAETETAADESEPDISELRAKS